MTYNETLVLIEEGHTQYLVPQWSANKARLADSARRFTLSNIVIQDGVVVRNRYGKVASPASVLRDAANDVDDLNSGWDGPGMTQAHERNRFRRWLLRRAERLGVAS